MDYGSVDVSTGSKNQYNRICYNTSFPFRQRVATCGFSRDLNCDGRMLDPSHLVLQCGRLGVSVGKECEPHHNFDTCLHMFIPLVPVVSSMFIHVHPILKM